MGALIRTLAPYLARLLKEFFAHFGRHMLRFFFWLKVARFGIFMIKAGILVYLIQALASGITALVGNLSASLPPMLADGFTRVLPDNFGVCVSAILMAKFLVFTFQIKDRLLSLNGSV